MKIQLQHPTGKKAVSIDKAKYDVLKKHVLNCLKIKEEATHADMLQSITNEFKKSKLEFTGSVEWYMEWVKLDLEAKKKIKRISNTSPIKFILV